MRRQARTTRPAPPADEVAPLGTGNNHTKPIDALAIEMGLPPGTMTHLNLAGKGPPTFKVGRRLFCRVADFYEWLDKIAAGKIDATLTASKRRHLSADEVPRSQPRSRPRPRQRRSEERPEAS